MNISLHGWIRISLFNLLVVAFLGMILRYKIAFPLPLVEQKHILEAHSHFAFAGWISQALMTLVIAYLSKHVVRISYKRYEVLLSANLLCAYGMLFSFPFEGYGIISIIFSTSSILTAYAFVIIVWRDLNKITENSVTVPWLKASLVFNAFSSLGAFALAFMMANKITHQNWYLLAVYFFLHFQYNGWFFFACMGLISEKIPINILSATLRKKIFYLFAFACVPAYFLSVLWLDLPFWIYAIIVAAALAQVIGWSLFVQKIIPGRKMIFYSAHNIIRLLLLFSAAALSVKLLLQLGSTIPSLSTWAFGFRSIVIGYLHLILLGVITLYLLFDIMYEGFMPVNKKTIRGVMIFACSIIVNELLLMTQGLADISYHSVPYANELLFGAACAMFIGLLILLLGKNSRPDELVPSSI